MKYRHPTVYVIVENPSKYAITKITQTFVYKSCCIPV